LDRAIILLYLDENHIREIATIIGTSASSILQLESTELKTVHWMEKSIENIWT
jgi:DNA-directed RNA polymerase specialized sigma subunit